MSGRARVADKGDDHEPRSAAPHGLLRRFLKLIVEADSSRHVTSRATSLVILLAILALFALTGYGLAAWLSSVW